MLFTPFNSYQVHQPYGRDWTVERLEFMIDSNFHPEGFPIDGDAMTIAMKAKA